VAEKEKKKSENLDNIIRGT